MAEIVFKETIIKRASRKFWSLFKKSKNEEKISQEYIQSQIDSGKKILDLGCGKEKVPCAIGIDFVELNGVDIVQDLNIMPWKGLDYESFDEIHMNDIIEHLNDPVKVIGECYKLLKPGGKLFIKVVYWNHKYSYSDPSHKHGFSEIYFKFFIGERQSHYLDFKFQDLNIEYLFDQNAVRKFGKNKKRLFKKAYFYCNIIQGMYVTLTK